MATLAAFGCGAAMPSLETQKEAGKPPPMPERFSGKCDAAKTQLRPLVVEWTAPDRAALESQAQKGPLVVRYSGCDMEVLRRCKAPPKYAYGYTAITPKDETVTISSADELYASIPVHAASFEGKLAQSGQLRAEMTIVGEYGVGTTPPSHDQLKGECEGATHVVTALVVGAFSFSAGSARSAAVSASVLGLGAGAKTERASETLSRDGDVGSCSASKRGDEHPPSSCGALLRLELAGILPAGEGVPDCRPGTKLVGKKCVGIDKPLKLATEDESFTDDKRGFGWGTRCYHHLRAGALPFARAACQRGLDAGPDDPTRSAILFNFGLVEEAAGDPVAACEKLSQALVLKPSRDVQKRIDALKCAELLKPAH